MVKCHFILYLNNYNTDLRKGILMACSELDRDTRSINEPAISFPETNDPNSPWKLYNYLIDQVPEDLVVSDYCLGTHWCYVEAEGMMGVAFTCKGGARRTFTQDFRGLPLKQVAELSKSWCFEEASLGIAALNAWFSQREKLDPLGAIYDIPQDMPEDTIRKLDAFELYRPRLDGKKITVIGHFPHVERIAEYGHLTVLERNCTSEVDTPDPACEYVLPHQDFAFITGVTLINKTAPRLLELCKDVTTILVGPSVVPDPLLFDWGVETLAGSVVADQEKVKHAVMSGAGRMFGEALQMAAITRR